MLVGDDKPGMKVEWLLGVHDIAGKYAQPQLAASTLSEFQRVCSSSGSGLQLKQHGHWWRYMAHALYDKASDHDRTPWREALLRLTRIHATVLIQNEELIREVTTDVPDSQWIFSCKVDLTAKVSRRLDDGSR